MTWIVGGVAVTETGDIDWIVGGVCLNETSVVADVGNPWYYRQNQVAVEQ